MCKLLAIKCGAHIYPCVNKGTGQIVKLQYIKYTGTLYMLY